MKTIVGIAEIESPKIGPNTGFNFKVFETNELKFGNLGEQIPNILQNSPIESVYHLNDGPESEPEAILHHIVEKYLGFEVICFQLRGNFPSKNQYMDSDSDLFAVAVGQPAGMGIRKSQNKTDFFDMLRDLDEALRQISEHVRGINDPSVLDARLRQLKASAEALRCYIDIDDDNGPDEVPVRAVMEVNENLKKIDVLKVSSEVLAWVKTAKDIITLWLKLRGS